MNIALLHYAAHPIVGGVESVMQEHARLLTQAGHHVRIIAGRGAQLDSRVDFKPVHLVDSLAAEILSLKASLDKGEVPAEFEPVSNAIETELRGLLVGFDWLIAHNVCSLNKNLALTSALRRIAMGDGPRLILWHHDLAWTTPRYRPELHEGYPWDLLKIDWQGALQVTVSAARAQELATLLDVNGSRVHVVPNGIDLHQFLQIDAETSALSDRLGLIQAEPLLLVPVRVTPRKNIEMALRIVAAMRLEFPRVRLLITGPVGAHNSSNRTYLESLLQQSRALEIDHHAIFLTQSHSEPIADTVMRQLYRLADALLLPSREEGFGIPIIEAGVSRIPVFCSEIPPLVEVGQQDVYYFAPDGDPASVARQIGSVLSGNRQHNLRKRAARDYGWDQIYALQLAPLLDGDSK